MTLLKLEAKQDHLVQVASVRDPIKGLAEFVWNAVDADAQNVWIDFLPTALGGATQSIIIRDDGNGISNERARSAFEGLGDSWKKSVTRTQHAKRILHGKEGRGRLRFYSLADRATWNSTYKEDGKLFAITIDIHSAALDTSELSGPVPSEALSTGTSVELADLREGLDWLSSDAAKQQLTTIFAPYLLQYPTVSIFYAGKRIDTKTTIDREYDFPVRVLVGPHRTIKDLTLKVIEWTTADGGRRINLGQSAGVVLGSVPAEVRSPEFNFSAYAYSSYFQEMADKGLLELGDLNDEDFNYILKAIRRDLSDYFRRRHSERASGLIEELKQSGAYPYEGEPKDAIETRERQLFDIATYTVASFSREFSHAESAIQRITLTLMKEALRTNPDSLGSIFRAAMRLPKEKQDAFSALIDKTELGNIISASTLVANRKIAIEVLRGIVFDPKFKFAARERGELDVLVRDNTWLFGENFHITVQEAGLTKVMRRVAEDLGSGRRPRNVRKISGGVGRVDLMLGRSVPHPDPNKREYLLIELKRPSLVLSKKELDQVEEYLLSLSKQDDFRNTDTSWTLYLVGGSCDETVQARITQSGRAVGLAYEQSNAKVWVKTWAEVIRENEGRFRFIQDELQIGIEDQEIENRIAQLRSSVLKTPENEEEFA